MEKQCDLGHSSNDDRRPIGIFDSGVGGLSVWIEIRTQLPFESTIYFADQAHVPYGSRSLLEVRDYAFRITEFLLNQGAKLIVVACNTASGAALQHLRHAFPHISFVGMEPAVKPAVENTHSGHIGVIATPTTFQGPLYQQLVSRFGRGVKIHTQICPGLVDAIEAGNTQNQSIIKLLQNCLMPLTDQNIDQLVLGCTHYPFIIPIAQRILGEAVTLINPAPAVARQTGRILEKKALLCKGNLTAQHIFFTSGSVSHLRKTAQALVGYTGAVSKTTWKDSHLYIKK